MRRFLLDTNILLGLAREAPWASWAYNRFRLADPDVISFTSVVCVGEFRALAEKFGWGREKRDRLDALLQELPAVQIRTCGPDRRAGVSDELCLVDRVAPGRPTSAVDGWRRRQLGVVRRT